MTLWIQNAMIYRAHRRVLLPGDLLVRDGRIAAVSQGEALPASAVAGAVAYDAEGCMLLPGFVDVHTHGRGGGDFVSADEETLCRMADSYLASGVTTVLPTLASAPLEDMSSAIDRINKVSSAQAEHRTGARFAGVHLEGRYLNPAKRGAHAPHLLSSLDPDEACALLSRIDGIKHISAALELDRDHSFLSRVLAAGATVGLGHTSATYAEAVEAIERGVTSLTHLYNAMPPLHHRDGGAVCAGLLTPTVYCELICDGFHISPEMVKLAYALKGDHLTLITDSMEATGCADGEYTIAGMPVTVKDGKARTHDGAIAGSTLSMWDAVKNLRDFAGISLEVAVYAATMAPALQVGLESEVGSLETGKRADLVVIDDRMQIKDVMCGGVLRAR